MSVDLWIFSLAIIGSCLTQLGDHPGETEAVRARLSPAGHQQLLAAATQVSPRCHPALASGRGAGTELLSRGRGTSALGCQP